METPETHSKAKLALAVITSPSAAFEEILRRKLLREAFLISAIAGTLAMIAAILQSRGHGGLHLFTLGYANPITWVGLMMLYGLALHFLLRWLGTAIDYSDVLTILGWSQVTLALANLLGLTESILSPMFGHTNSSIQMLGWAALAINLWYVAPVAIGIVTSTGTNLARGILSYLMVHMAAFIGFTHTYSGSRRDLFKDATVGIFYASQSVVAADKTPWLAAGFAGYALGLWFLAKDMGWPGGVRMRRVISAGLVGAVALGGYYYALWKTDYYGHLLTAQRLFERDEYALAATKLEELLPRMPDETGYISLDIADYSYDAGDDKKATEFYNKSLKNLPPQKGTDRIYQEAHAILGLGMVADIGGDYKTAIAEFEKAAKLWPQFREPLSRLAVTYARMGNYDKALESANKAVDKLKSDSPEAYLVLAQVHAAKGDTEKAAAAYKRLAKLDDRLADRIGAKPEGWKNAVSKLTRSDLQFPLEKGIAMPPEQPGAKKAAKPTAPKKK